MPNINSKTLFKPASGSGMSYKQQVDNALSKNPNSIDYHRIVMLSAMKTTTKDGKDIVLAEFGVALDQKDPATLVKEDARFGLKNSFRRDDAGNLVVKDGETADKTADGVNHYQTSSLQPISMESYNKIIKNAAQTPRLDKDGNQVYNQKKDAQGNPVGPQTPIYYAVFEAPLRRVEKVVTDKNGVEVRDPNTHQVYTDMYYAPVLEAAHFFETENGKIKMDGKKPVTIPPFDAQKHFDNAKLASTLESKAAVKEAASVQAQAQAEAEGQLVPPEDDGPDY